MMNDKIPEVDIVVDESTGVIREAEPLPKLRSKKAHERRVNGAAYTVLVIMSIVWLVPFVFLVLQSFRSYILEKGGMVDYLIPKHFSLDNYRFLFEGSNFFPWMGRALIVAVIVAALHTVLMSLTQLMLDRLPRVKRNQRMIFICGVVLVTFLALLGVASAVQGMDWANDALSRILKSLVLYAAAGVIFSRLFLNDQNKLLATLPGFEPEGLKTKVKRCASLFAEMAATVVVLLMILTPMQTSQYLRWYGNTLTIALFVSVLQTIVVLSVSYALSRLRFKGRKLIMNVVLVLGMFPGFLTMVTLYFLLRELGMTHEGAVPGLILIYVASSGMGYYISKGFFDTIPKSLDESARIDGATRLQVFYKIIMPLAKPIVIYTVLMAFMAPWGDYVFASYVAGNKLDGYNVAVGLYKWVNTNDYQNYFTRFCAGGVLVALPITALFLALQKYYVEGVTGGAVKG